MKTTPPHSPFPFPSWHYRTWLSLPQTSLSSFPSLSHLSDFLAIVCTEAVAECDDLFSLQVKNMKVLVPSQFHLSLLFHEGLLCKFQRFQLGILPVLSILSLGIKLSLLFNPHYFKLHWIVYWAYITYSQHLHFLLMFMTGIYWDYSMDSWHWK